MNTEQQIEYLATKIMRWDITCIDGKLMVRVPQEIPGLGEDCSVSTWTTEWNPPEDWNHWRQVEEKVMEDEDLWRKFISTCNHGHSEESKKWQTMLLMQADLPARVAALISAHQQLNK